MAFTWIWATLAVILVFIIFVIILVIILRDRLEEESIIFQCPIGTNPVNFYTGVRYPDRSTYNAVFENCQPVGLCTEAPNTFAVQPNGSSIPEICTEGTNCNCVRTKNCPNVIKAFFSPFTINGQRFWNSQGVYLTQSGEATWDTPLQTSSDQLCSLGASSLPDVFNHTCVTGRLTALSDGTFGCKNAPPCTAGNPTFDLQTQEFSCQNVSNWPNFWND
jgi:hypothetical protein